MLAVVINAETGEIINMHYVQLTLNKNPIKMIMADCNVHRSALCVHPLALASVVALKLLPEDTKPATCKSDATPVCTARRSFQAQSDYGTVYLQIPDTSHLTASSWSCRRLISSDHALKFL